MKHFKHMIIVKTFCVIYPKKTRKGTEACHGLYNLHMLLHFMSFYSLPRRSRAKQKMVFSLIWLLTLQENTSLTRNIFPR